MDNATQDMTGQVLLIDATKNSEQATNTVQFFNRAGNGHANSDIGRREFYRNGDPDVGFQFLGKPPIATAF